MPRLALKPTSAVRPTGPLSNVTDRPGIGWAAFGALNAIALPPHAAAATTAPGPMPLAPVVPPLPPVVPPVPPVPEDGPALGVVTAELWATGEVPPLGCWPPADAWPARFPDMRFDAADWSWAPRKCTTVSATSATAAIAIARRVQRPNTGSCSSAPCIWTGAVPSASAVTWNARCCGAAVHETFVARARTPELATP